MSTATLTSPYREKLISAVQLSNLMNLDHVHALQVTRLSLQLFDATVPLHEYGETERLWLAVAALLHDCGKVMGKKDHHMTSQSLIINLPSLQFPAKEKRIIAMIARYHRGAYPHSTDKYFRNIGLERQKTVEVLSGILRLTDGLAKKAPTLQAVSGTIGGKHIQLDLYGIQQINMDRVFQNKKLHYFELIFNKSLKIKTTSEPTPTDNDAWIELLRSPVNPITLHPPGTREKPQRTSPVLHASSDFGTLHEQRMLTSQRRRRLTG